MVGYHLCRSRLEHTVLLTLLCLPMSVSITALGQESLGVPDGSSCDFYGNGYDEELFIFSSSIEANRVVSEIVDSVGIVQNFQLWAANVPYVSGGLFGDKRSILYNQQRLYTDLEGTEQKWVVYTLFAHQIGHHLLLHDLSNPQNRGEYELEADTFAGSVLSKLGASKKEALSALELPEANVDSPLMPPKEDRAAAISRGWDQSQTTVDQTLIRDGFAWSTAPNVPQFEWPPPRASASATVPHEHLLPEHRLRRLIDVSEWLERALDQASYAERSYYAVPDGFALVSRLERINQDGTPHSERWASDESPSLEFSLKWYLRALVSSPEGRYRLVVFVVTPAAFPQNGKNVPFLVARDWSWVGLNKLPPSAGVLELSKDHTCTALVYEFVKGKKGSEPSQVLPSVLTGRQHLESSGIWAGIGK